MERILIIINKSWEADAVFAALFNDDFKLGLPDNLQQLWKTMSHDDLDYPFKGKQGDAKPRVTFTVANFCIEIWCLNTVMTPRQDNTDFFYYSRAIQKAADLPKIFNYSTDPIKLLIAYGTAGLPSEVSKNGGIVVGSKIFPYNAGKTKPNFTYTNVKMGTQVVSTISQDFFDKLNIGASSIAMRLYFETSVLATPQNPSNAFQLIADPKIVAIGDINVSSYMDFDECDKAALTAYSDLQKATPVYKTDIAYSVETTHSVIRLESPCDNFIFVSAITDRDAYFDSEVTPKVHAQNFSASFNGGVFFNFFIPFLFNYYLPGTVAGL